MASTTRIKSSEESSKFMNKKHFSQNRKNKFDHKEKFGQRKSRLNEIDEEISELESKYSQINPSNIKKFTDLPLSNKTQIGLKWAKFDEPTDIQKESIGLALQGHDLLCAAKTGSGKTLAFLIPILENLYRQKWSRLDGLGALIISPTRELAYQIFEVLRKIGKRHDFSAGLVIGGKHVREEAERINKTNVVICTPGRLLQHMDETAFFTADNLQILVLDEADRILDMGFQDTMNAIVQNLPETRQTCLFSATQTKSVKDLARLSLKNPIYVSVHEHSQHSTPSSLQQSYIVCELHEKINMLWSFVKHHLKSKVIVFLSSCKQVKYVYEAFRRIRPGVTILCLNGDMKQLKRVAVYEQFCRKNHAVLFATDIAARGLDFPAVNWVVQLDCPEDANTYIHRAGRTARYEKDGEALLFLLPSEEEAMLSELQLKKIPINKIKVNPKRQWSIQAKLESQCAADVELKSAAQRAFVSYLRSVFLMANKKVFDVFKLDTDKYSSSLGLAIAPRIRFLQKEIKRREEVQRKSKSSKHSKDSDAASDDSDEDEDGSQSSAEDSDKEKPTDAAESATQLLMDVMSRTKKPTKQTKNAESRSKSTEDGGSSPLRFHVDVDEDVFLTVKKKHKVEEFSEDEEEEEENEADEVTNQPDEKESKKKEKQLTKYAIAKKLKKKNIQVNTKITFDDSGEVVEDTNQRLPSAAADDGDVSDDEETGGINIEKARQRMREVDKHDKRLYQEKIKKKHREERIKRKEKNRKPNRQENDDDDEEFEVTLGGADDEQNSGDEYDEDGEKIRDSDAEDSTDEESGSEDDDGPPRKKPRMRQNNGGDDESEEDSNDEEMDEDDDDDDESYDDNSDDDDEDNDVTNTLADDEELALKLLHG